MLQVMQTPKAGKGLSGIWRKKLTGWEQDPHLTLSATPWLFLGGYKHPALYG